MTAQNIFVIAESITARDEPSQFVIRPELGYFTDIRAANMRAVAASDGVCGRLYTEYVTETDRHNERAQKHNAKIDRMLAGFRRETNPDAYDDIAGDRQEIRPVNRDFYSWQVSGDAPAVRHRVVTVEPGSMP
ncbi:hypothetical protein [Aeromicrobium sp. 179-A 4D2 NHS]|uniref:hypothetical protein n=1 Tax=Aeromicrobium sp. 179-A 4D2 NHS TaxID=3142375 RepID=UPI0039A06BC9